MSVILEYICLPEYGYKFKVEVVGNKRRWVSFYFGPNNYIFSVYTNQLIYFKSNIHFLFYSLIGCLSDVGDANRFCENLK